LAPPQKPTNVIFSEVMDIMMESSETERRVEEYSALIERQHILIKQLEKSGADATSARIIFDSLSVSLSLSLHDRHRVRCYVEAGQPKRTLATHETAGSANSNGMRLNSVLGDISQAASQLAFAQMSDLEDAAVGTPSMHVADREMNCAKCGEALSVPKWSESLGTRRVINLWSCAECGYSFVETPSEVGYPGYAAA
jgi:hypothetical protein